LAATSDNGTVSIWDLDSRRQIGRPLPGHTDAALGVTFAEGGNTLVTSSWDGSLIFWDLRPSSWAAKACALAGRNLTADEWNQFVGGDYQRTCPQWPKGYGSQDLPTDALATPLDREPLALVLQP
jgi:WD40 repeat protein